MQLVTRVSTLPKCQNGKKAAIKLRTSSVTAPIVRSYAESAKQHSQALRVFAPNDDTGGRLEAEVQARPGSHVYTVSLKKPLGLTLAEQGGRIVIESVNTGGHAESAGVARGDVLLATSARAQVTAGKDALRGQLVLLSVGGESFATIAAAIRSNTCSQCKVHLVLERLETAV